MTSFLVFFLSWILFKASLVTVEIKSLVVRFLLMSGETALSSAIFISPRSRAVHRCWCKQFCYPSTVRFTRNCECLEVPRAR